jgi:hypothetical protein
MDLSETKNLPKVDHTPAELDEPAKLLLKAANWMEKYGKCEGIRVDSKGRVCVLGAIDRAGGFHPYGDMDPLWKKAVERLASAIPPAPNHAHSPTINAAWWNNDPKRPGAEIVAKLRAVALGL